MAYLAESGDEKYFFLDRFIGSNRRLKAWVYITTDDRTTVTTAGYFDDIEFAQAVMPGDRITVLQATDRNDLSTEQDKFEVRVTSKTANSFEVDLVADLGLIASQAQAEAGTSNGVLMTPLRTAQAFTVRIGETKSVLEFGAVGDCVAVSTGTDDSAAIQLAFDWLTDEEYRRLYFPPGYRWRISNTCTADWDAKLGGQIAMDSPIIPDPGIGRAFELVHANEVDFRLWVEDGGQTADYSVRDPVGGDEAFYVRGVRGGTIHYEGYDYLGRVMRLTKEMVGEPKTSRLSLFGKTGDFGSLACGQNVFADVDSAFGSFHELHAFWDEYGPVIENAADVFIYGMDSGFRINSGMEIRGVLSFWGHRLSLGDDTQTVDLITFKPSVTDLVTHNAVNYTALAHSIGIEPGVTSGWASYWSASGAGGDAWSATKHYILGRNCGNINANIFALGGKKNVVLDSIGLDSSIPSGKFSINSMTSGEHGLHMTTCGRVDVFLDSANDEVPFETVGACSGHLKVQTLNARKQVGIIGASAVDFNISGIVQNANSDEAASTSVFDVNSTGRNIVFRDMTVFVANNAVDADYVYDLVASNNVAILGGCLTIGGSTVPIGANAPVVAKDIRGWRTYNEGNAVILSGNTSVSVTHGLGVAAQKIIPANIELTGLNNAEVSAPFAGSVGDTTFTINVGAAVTADRTVYWKASKYQSQA